MLIDSHVNLHAPQFEADRDEVIARARAAGVGLLVNIADRASTIETSYAVAAEHADIWATVGTHPHEAKENPQLKVDDLMQLAERVRNLLVLVTWLPAPWSVASPGTVSDPGRQS